LENRAHIFSLSDCNDTLKSQPAREMDNDPPLPFEVEIPTLADRFESVSVKHRPIAINKFAFRDFRQRSEALARPVTMSLLSRMES